MFNMLQMATHVASVGNFILAEDITHVASVTRVANVTRATCVIRYPCTILFYSVNFIFAFCMFWVKNNTDSR